MEQLPPPILSHEQFVVPNWALGSEQNPIPSLHFGASGQFAPNSPQSADCDPVPQTFPEANTPIVAAANRLIDKIKFFIAFYKT
jgi:hypothetical protein